MATRVSHTSSIAIPSSAYVGLGIGALTGLIVLTDKVRSSGIKSLLPTMEELAGVAVLVGVAALTIWGDSQKVHRHAPVSLERMSQTLDKWDFYPIISSLYSAPARTLLGSAQVIKGVVLGFFSLALDWRHGYSIWKTSLRCHMIEVLDGITNVTRGVFAFVPVLGNIAIYLYEKSPLGPVVLARDDNGLYTLPRVNVPGVSGTMQGSDLCIRIDDFHLDTAQGIVPRGWRIR